MAFERLFELVKEARSANALPDLAKPPEIKPIATLGTPKKAPKVKPVKKIPELKLDNGLGKMKPFNPHEFKTNSPYNEK